MTDPGRQPLGLLAVAAETESLADRLEHLLQNSSHETLKDRAGSIPSAQAHDAVQIAFVGQYNAGKSSLLRCLTGRDDIPTGADVKTNRTTHYEWHSHLLIDTPGVLAGVDRRHDRLAEMATASADVVAFVATAEGFDDVVGAYFQSVRDRHQSSSQLVLVVNKANAEDSQQEEVEAHLREVVGDLYDVLPVVWTDAEDWLLADKFPNPSARRTSSNIRGLAETLSEVTRAGGAHLRLATPLRELSHFVRECLDSVSTAGDEAPALAGLDAAEAAIERQRERMIAAAGSGADRARVRLGEELFTEGPDISDQELLDAVQRVRQAYDAAFAEEGQKVSDALSQELARYEPNLPALRMSALQPVVDVVSHPSWAAIRQSVLDGLARVAREFGGAGARAGGTGHTVITNAWHAVGGKFRPWGAVNASRTVSKAAKVLGPALVIGEGCFDLHRQWRSATQQREEFARLEQWNRHVEDMARRLTREWADAAALGVQEYCDAQLATVRRKRLALLMQGSERDADVAALVQIGSDLQDVLDELLSAERAGSAEPGT